MALPNAKNQYLKTQIETASKEQLVVMLFDGIIRFTENARKAMQEEKIEESHNALMRAQAIVMELICTLDKDQGGEIADSLMSLHAYAFNCLIVCNMKKDISKIDEVQHIYRELREGWVGAMERLGVGAKPVAAPTLSQPAVPPTAKAPLSAALPKAAPTAPAAAPAPANAPSPAATPATSPLGGSGVMASSAGYGMGRAALMAGMKPSPVVAPAPAASATPATPAPASAAAPAAAPVPTNAKQAAMLNAYGKTRSIA